MSLQGTSTLVSPLTSRDFQLAELGAIVTANNTPGSALTGHAAPTTFDETKALLYIYNNSGLTLFPSSLRLKLSNAGTAGTTIRFEQIVDTGNDRFSSGGSTLVVQSTNPSLAPATLPTVRFGAVVLTAQSASRKIVTGA